VAGLSDARVAVSLDRPSDGEDKTPIESGEWAAYVEFYERCARILLAFYRVLVRNFAPYSRKKNCHR